MILLLDIILYLQTYYFFISIFLVDTWLWPLEAETWRVWD